VNCLLKIMHVRAIKRMKTEGKFNTTNRPTLGPSFSVSASTYRSSFDDKKRNRDAS